MKSREIARRRMYSQHLWGPRFETPEDVVKWLGALQSQEFPVAKWSVAQRTSAVDNAATDQAFADGAILRTHVLRPTWHFVLPEDIRWLLDLTAPRVNARNAPTYRNLELDGGVFAKSDALLAKVLEGGRHLTRRELGAMLDRAGITATGPRLAHIFMHAELAALVCSGAPKGKQHTYALLDERAPQAKSLGRDEALAELTERFFTARGPATVRDYVRWSSLATAEAKSGLEMVSSLLEHEVVDGRTYWCEASAQDAKPRSPVIDLVQGYDECVMSHSESKDVLYGSMTADTVPRGRAAFMHAVLLDGQLIGHWRSVRQRNSVVVEAALYREFNRFEARAMAAAVQRYERFLGLPVTLAVT
jgi:hypothetical protein